MSLCLRVCSCWMSSPFLGKSCQKGIIVAQAVQNYLCIHLVLTMLIHKYVEIIKITVGCSLRLLLKLRHSFWLQLHYIHYTRKAVINDITVARQESLRQRNNATYHHLKYEDQRTTEEYKTSFSYFLSWQTPTILLLKCSTQI